MDEPENVVVDEPENEGSPRVTHLSEKQMRGKLFSRRMKVVEWTIMPIGK